MSAASDPAIKMEIEDIIVDFRPCVTEGSNISFLKCEDMDKINAVNSQVHAAINSHILYNVNFGYGYPIMDGNIIMILDDKYNIIMDARYNKEINKFKVRYL